MTQDAPPMVRIEFWSGGYLLCHRAADSKTGRSVVVTVGECTCYKSLCDCVFTFNLPKNMVKSVVTGGDPPGQRPTQPGTAQE